MLAETEAENVSGAEKSGALGISIGVTVYPGPRSGRVVSVLVVFVAGVVVAATVVVATDVLSSTTTGCSPVRDFQAKYAPIAMIMRAAAIRMIRVDRVMSASITVEAPKQKPPPFGGGFACLRCRRKPWTQDY